MIVVMSPENMINLGITEIRNRKKEWYYITIPKNTIDKSIIDPDEFYEIFLKPTGMKKEKKKKGKPKKVEISDEFEEM